MFDRLLADLQLFRRHAEVDLNAAVDHAHWIRVHGEHRRQRSDLPRDEVETRAVTRALHQAVFKLALAENTAVVGTDVLDRAPRAVLALPDAAAHALRLDDRDLARADIPGVGDADERAQSA